MLRDGPPKLGRSVQISAAAVDQLIRARALEWLTGQGQHVDALDFARRAQVFRDPDGGATVAYEG